MAITVILTLFEEETGSGQESMGHEIIVIVLFPIPSLHYSYRSTPHPPRDTQNSSINRFDTSCLYPKLCPGSGQTFVIHPIEHTLALLYSSS